MSASTSGNGDEESSVAASCFSNEDDEDQNDDSGLQDCDPTMKEFFQKTMNSGVQDGVVCFKLLVLGVLVVAALVVGNAAFVFTSQELEEEYNSEFENAAHDMIKHSQERVTDILTGSQSFKNNIISDSMDMNLTWPYITVPDFEARHREFLQQTVATEVSLVCLVSDGDRKSWEDYTVANQQWVQEGLSFQGNSVEASAISTYIHIGSDSLGNPIPAPSGVYPRHAVNWQIAPSTSEPDAVNFNVLESDFFMNAFQWLETNNSPIISEVLSHNKTGTGVQSYLLQPMCNSFDEKEEPDIVGVFLSAFSWEALFRDILEPAEHLILVLGNECGQTFTFQVHGPVVTFVGEGDFPDLYMDEESVQGNLTGTSDVGSYCPLTMTLFSSKASFELYESNDPLVYTSVALLTFALAIALFLMYDCCVERRNLRITKTAARNDKLISSLFPDQVKGQVLDQAADKPKKSAFSSKAFSSVGANKNSSSIIPMPTSKPIAELFPSTTVVYADIVGFTAWSSVREPSQVFTLLETIYNKFDATARKLGVFKVETIGDCYVAVCGLPKPRKDHTMVMARFAHSCLGQMLKLVQELEVTLGPDTGDLSMRFGLHSGAVTGGVLRGEKSRFQLYGDTVNIAAKMEHTGEAGKIHISKETAEGLKSYGKSSWATPRLESFRGEDDKGMETFWLVISSPTDQQIGQDRPKQLHHLRGLLSIATLPSALKSIDKKAMSEKLERLGKKKRRLVHWNANLLLGPLKKIAAIRGNRKLDPSLVLGESDKGRVSRNKGVLDDVQEIIRLPTEATPYKQDPSTVTLPPQVVSQLTDYIATIATMYNDNPFHSFEHASHVTMSTTKLLSRIISPKDMDTSQERHQYTYGITSDPLAQFAITFSALIHDVDHSGLPNAQLVHEQTRLAQVYDNKSVAEQHAVDLAWDLLMEPAYQELRRCIYRTDEERTRFRHLVVNSVMATDIVDTDLKALRNARWEKAFAESRISSSDASVASATSVASEGTLREHVNRKATIVIEHLIQASDVAHTMQHWMVYQRWNERLFREQYFAYRVGRSASNQDPAVGWYDGELGFYDHYIIPLARKLEECSVFGVSSDEYLNYALENRREWQIKGRQVVESMHQRAIQEYEDMALQKD